MVCRKCGKEIPEGSLYCEKCGADVRIVPVFEAEVEHTMEKTLSKVFEDAFPEEAEPEEEADETLSKTHNHLWLGIVLGTLICITLIGMTVYFYLGNSLEYQLEKGTMLYQSGEYETAIPYLEKALELDKENIENQILLADAYLAARDEVRYLEMLDGLKVYMEDIPILRTIICDRYVSFYVGKGDYTSLHKALSQIVTESIYESYASYIVTEAVFSHSAGYYKEIIPLKLSNTGKGTIYYTLDGSEPTTDSLVYEAPIFLSEGEYVVKALFVSNTGVYSEIVTQEYEIEKQPPAAPLVIPTSGEFSERQTITVDKEEYEDVYYTTNGTNPTTSSERYIGPIEMPTGYTLFRFIKVSEDGRVSEITEREYLLFINEPTEETKESP